MAPMPGELVSTPIKKTKNKNNKPTLGRDAPKDGKYWTWETREEDPQDPVEVAWGSGKDPIEDGKHLRNRAVRGAPSESAPKSLADRYLQPSQRSASRDEDQGQENRSQFSPDVGMPSAKGEEFGRPNNESGDDDEFINNKINTTISPSRDEVETKVPGTDLSERGDESESEVENALNPEEPTQTKDEIDFDGDDEGDTEDDGDVSDARNSMKGSENGNGSESDGWKTVPRSKSVSPVNKLSPVRRFEGNERYFPKDTPVEETEGEEDDSMLVSSARLPAARKMNYDKSRSLDTIAQNYGIIVFTKCW
ncbi:hypothetical protein BJ322DRAFT_1017853 [Thelephora terrestris]|uniref:Uncharacterized protein n=1 Tax=Thelephora terrestris TaxID=56493 RepID=A0A9P6H7J0_9AGAM|nr:hypothetical protein BJ322DRAFT_1023595 [Thelephora terrestris]KAF9789118.1 hypothetical protein BJ322DRAFT_1017853 [Thelephora terrestris]